MANPSSPVDLAQRLFAEFQKVYAARLSEGSIWYIAIQGNEAHLGFTADDARTAITVLTQKGLIKTMGIGRHQLTERGKEACLHPELREGRLGAPRPMTPLVQTSTVNVHGGHVQVGSNNTQNITYRSVLRAALETAEGRDDVPAPVASALRKLVEFPDIESLMSDADRKVRGA